MKINCNFIDDYLDDDLTPEQNDEFKSHLECCEECQSKASFEQSLNDDVRKAWATVPVPELDMPLGLPTTRGPNHSYQELSSQLNLLASKMLFALAALLVVMAIPGGWFWWFNDNDEVIVVQDGRKVEFVDNHRPVVFLSDSNPTTSVIVGVDSNQNNFTIVRAFEPYHSKQELKP